MGDNRTPAQDRKLLYVAPLVIAGLIIAIGLATFFRPPPAGPVATQAPPALPVIARSVPTLSRAPPLVRADLIGAARDAADAFTVSGKLPGGTDPLIGRRFSMRIPFGCGGVQGGYGPAQISMGYNADNQSITLTAAPGVWTSLPVMQAPGNADAGAVEGFWVPRPWTYADSCPLQLDYPVPPTPTPPTAQTLGLAQLFQADGSRVQQHADHPYTFTRKLPPDDPSILTHAYRLLLEGKITGYRDGHALHCWIEAPDHQPLCIYAVTIDHVAFQDAVTGELLANWND